MTLFNFNLKGIQFGEDYAQSENRAILNWIEYDEDLSSSNFTDEFERTKSAKVAKAEKKRYPKKGYPRVQASLLSLWHAQRVRLEAKNLRFPPVPMAATDPW